MEGRSASMVIKLKAEMKKYAEMRGKDNDHHQLGISKQLVRDECDVALNEHMIRRGSRPDLPTVTAALK
jgi:hypothetical protein